MSDHEQKKRKDGGRGGGGGRGSGGEGGERGGKRAKYFQQSKYSSGQAVPLGSQGILITCDAGREGKAGHEAVMLIEEHYDKLSDPTAAAEVKGDAGAAAVGSEDEVKEDGAAEDAEGGEGGVGGGDGGKDAGGKDVGGKDVGGKDAGAKDAGGKDAGGKDAGGKDVAALLAEEVAQLKDKKAVRFRVHFTGVKGCIYVIFPADPQPGAPGPVEVARAIVQEAKDRKQVRGRHIVRFLPVTHSCFASLEEIRAVAPKLLAPHFPEGDDVTPVEFAVEYEHRSAEGFERLDVINAFTAVIKTPPHKVNLKAPSTVVLVQLIRNGCVMAVLSGYRELAKFNVRKLAEVEEAS